MQSDYEITDYSRNMSQFLRVIYQEAYAKKAHVCSFHMVSHLSPNMFVQNLILGILVKIMYGAPGIKNTSHCIWGFDTVIDFSIHIPYTKLYI
jgi:hypothetical protein